MTPPLPLQCIKVNSVKIYKNEQGGRDVCGQNILPCIIGNGHTSLNSKKDHIRISVLISQMGGKFLRSQCEFYLLTIILEFEIMNGQNYEYREIQTQGGQS